MSDGRSADCKSATPGSPRFDSWSRHVNCDDDQRDIVSWLESDEGTEWSRNHFDDPSECHAFVEIIDDTTRFRINMHTSRSTPTRFHGLKHEVPQWADLDWTPDRPP